MNRARPITTEAGRPNRRKYAHNANEWGRHFPDGSISRKKKEQKGISLRAIRCTSSDESEGSTERGGWSPMPLGAVATIQRGDREQE
ncbi:hypothetical protein [Thermosporothrix hazakensis]|uniref:hypothetical protein n=1 Tax=Thermosporothrix hazakensis TaxID=644383 RepID=UPI0010EBFED4|nr:hypothetical protein [Thermosporothrix hazakensis]GCE50648.1 hypothetical protein KTH_55170 [Thermosporothrix hazakensis]